jgi:hypothetical protein
MLAAIFTLTVVWLARWVVQAASASVRSVLDKLHITPSLLSTHVIQKHPQLSPNVHWSVPVVQGCQSVMTQP